MATPKSEAPSYPVVNANPSLGDALIGFRLRDIIEPALLTSVTYIGAYLGSKRVVRRQNAFFCASFALFASSFISINRSLGRLRGYSENSCEIKKFGSLTQEEVNEIVEKNMTPIEALIGKK